MQKELLFGWWEKEKEKKFGRFMYIFVIDGSKQSASAMLTGIDEKQKLFFLYGF